MDPFLALVIATSVVQFLDFGAKLVGTGLEVYRSVEGTIKENLETECLVKHAKGLFTELKDSRSLKKGKNTKPDDAKLVELAQRSQVLAQELIDILGYIQGSGRHKS